MDRHIYLVLIGLAFLNNQEKLAAKKIDPHELSGTEVTIAI